MSNETTTSRRKPGGYVHRRYFRAISQRSSQMRKIAEETIAALELKQDATAKVNLYRLMALAADNARDCAEAVSDLEPNDRSGDI